MQYDDDELNRYYRYALALTGHDEEAFDLVHDALIKVSGKRFFRKDAYIFQTIRNLFYNTVKRMDRKLEPMPEAEISDAIDLEKIVGDAFDIKALMASLSDEDRELIYLIEVQGFTYKEVAKLTQTSQGTLLSKLHRAKQKLKEGAQRA